MARKITWCLCRKKPCGNPNSERCLDWFMQPIREDMSRAALDRVGAGLRATQGRDDGLMCCWCDGMTGRWVVCVWRRLRGDHASRGGRGSCPWRDLVRLQTTWPLRVTLARGCLSTHPQRTSSANGPLKALSSQSPPTPHPVTEEKLYDVQNELCSSLDEGNVTK